MSDNTYFVNEDDYENNNNDNQQDENNEHEILEPLDTTHDNISLDPIESVLFISYQNRKIAFAFYRIGSTKIELFHEMYEFEDFIVTRNVLAKFQPDNVFIGTNCDSKLYWFLRKLSSNFCEQIVTIMKDKDDLNESKDEENSIQHNEDADTTNSIVNNNDDEENSFSFTLEGDTTLNLLNNQFKLHIVPSKLYNYEQCKSRILLFNFQPISHQSDKTVRYIYLTAQIDFSEPNTIRSLGVLLFFIEKQLMPLANSNVNCISDLIYFFLDHFLSIDQTTYDALDIFKDEWHPSLSKKGFTKKESFSLYGVFNTCASKIGSNYLRKIFLQPCTDIDILEERLDIVEFFVCPENSYFKTSLYDFLKNIKHISPIINRFRGSNFQISDFRTLQQNLFSIISIKNLITNRLSNSDKNLKFFDKITDHFIIILNEILECIENTIDFDKSKDDGGKVSIKTGVDDELDKKKFYFNKLPEILGNSMDQATLIKEMIQTYNISITLLYVPQLGFLLQLPLIEVQKIADIDKYQLRFLFCAATAAYYKNSNTDEYDSLFGDIHGEINDMTLQNLIKIKEFIVERIDILLIANSYCAFLDAMIAISQAAIDMNFIRPKFNCKDTINIIEGRHPLYELITRSFMTNDYYCDSTKSSKTMIIFGQNGSGKTVYLKQICLIIFLAQIGSFVPAKLAEIQIMDKIFTRIRTPESISTQLSSFKLDLNQMIAATRFVKRRSLVIIDCFGKGTLYIDGLALLKSFINYWINNDQQPFLIISTHYNILAKMIPRDKVLFGRFDNDSRNYKLKLYQQNCNDVDDDDELSTIHTAPELIDLCKKVNDENRKMELIAKLRNKFQSYIQYADMILNNEQLDKINSFVKDVISNESTKENQSN